MAVTLPEEMPQPVDDHHVGHVVPMKILVGVFAALVFLTIATVSASYVDFGELNLVVALAIAVVKATLVVLFFMHLIWDRPFNAIVFVGCLIFVAIFIGFALIDSTQYHSSMDKGQASAMQKAHIPMKPETPANH
jgi:cytochrome c oxidase subunit 4